MSPDVLLFPMAAHVVWVTLLYAALTVARAPVAWGMGRRPDGSNPWAAVEKRVSANLRNQFEWPMLFYVACVMLVVEAAPLGRMAVVLAWLFVGGRVLHSLVQVLGDNVRWRGIVFTINFVAVLGLWWLLLR